MNCPICGAELKPLPEQPDRYYCPNEFADERHAAFRRAPKPPLKPGVPVHQVETVNQAEGERITLPPKTLAFIYVFRDPETGLLQTRVGVQISDLPAADQLILLAVLEEHAHSAIENLKIQQEQQAKGGSN